MKLVVMVPVMKDRVFTDRLQFPLTELSRQGGHQVIWCESIPHVLSAIRGADILVMTRPADAESIQAIRIAKKLGIKVVVDIDDAVHVIPIHNPMYVVWGTDQQVIEKWASMLRDDPMMFPTLDWVTKIDINLVSALAHGRRVALELCLRSADLVTAASQSLAQFYTSTLSLKNVVVLQNGVSAKEWDGIEHVSRPDNRVSVRWGGSFTHHDDLEELVMPMRTAIASCPILDFSIIGTGAHGNEQFSALPDSRFTSSNPVTHPEYMKWLSQADIIVAPSDGSAFSKCKSDIRVMQAGWMGIPVICSPSTYGKVVSEARMGLVAQSPLMWIKHLTALAEDKGFRYLLGQNGRQYVRNARTYEVMWRNWESAYGGL